MPSDRSRGEGSGKRGDNLAEAAGLPVGGSIERALAEAEKKKKRRETNREFDVDAAAAESDADDSPQTEDDAGELAWSVLTKLKSKGRGK